MKTLAIVAVVALASVGNAGVACAQNVRGFAAAGTTRDVNHQNFPTIGGGLLIEAGQPWVAVGAEAETFWSWPYFAGRGTVFGQVHVSSKQTVRPFALAGYGWGEEGGVMVGGGIEIRPRGSALGLRATVEDYVVHVRGYPNAYTGHQLAFRMGVSFR